ncbi:MAG: DUF2177 family protein [Rhizobiaceae bacterium]
MKYAQAYAIAIVIFLVLDGLWLGIVARSLYASRLGPIMLDQPRWGVAAIFYALFVVGLIYFAVKAGLETGSATTAALNGALFGFFTYLTYGATTLAVFKGFDGPLTVIDTAWGVVLGGAVAGSTVWIMQRLGWAG